MIKQVYQSQLPSKCLKDSPKEDVSINSKWLIRGGFINRLMAGAYSYLPLGMRVLHKVEDIVREEMNAIGSFEILMPALHPQQNWDTTGRWDKMADIIYKVTDGGDKTFGLGPTHEEIVTPLMGAFIQSYKDLPTSVYQIQTKYRKEARPKSGLLRGREFRMKDMYSFHTDTADLDSYYERAIEAYHKIFQRCGIGDRTFLTYASGGVFSKYSHEFQAITPYGEDTIYLNTGKKIAVNKEIIDDVSDDLGISKDTTEAVRAIEVGNIFKLGTRFSDAFGLTATMPDSTRQSIQMGCYGIGTSRIVGTCVELCHDDNGIIWPAGIAPFDVHVIVIGTDEKVLSYAKELAAKLVDAGKEVLIDDRSSSPGQKFAESDIIGIPYKIICSPKLQEKSKIEIKSRKTGEIVEASQAEALEVYTRLSA
ncbi:MAG: aminoacyl--tRNA ligase-related protein [Alphaproteobacteria bacterium]